MDPPPPARFESNELRDEPTGEDAYARRLRLSQSTLPTSVPPPPPPSGSHLPHAPPPPPVEPGQPPAPTISRAPVRYNLPAAPSELPASEAELEDALAQEETQEDEPQTEDQERSRRPGQKGFAERLLSKYGWSKGTGLGADGSGIINPLRVQVEKKKKKSDAEGGGFRDPPGARGKIIGGKKNNTEGDGEVGKFGRMSEVIVLKGMVDGMDLDEEVGDGGLMQEIGDECSEKVSFTVQIYWQARSNTPLVWPR
jgi:splicing factor 45